MERLHEEYGCSTLKEARTLLEDLTKQQEDTEEEYNDLLASFEEQYGDLLG